MEQWYLQTKKADFANIAAQFNISPILARIIRNRDIITREQFSKYLSPEVTKTYDPFLMKDMAEGIELAHKTVKSRGRIRIIGDYDADGICASIILSDFFESIGADVDVRLPDRILDGYGINCEMVGQAASDGIKLIITCDNGISGIDAVKKAREAGINVIITDHHEPSDILPEADAVIDAKQHDCTYPFKEICGAAVAYKFIQAYDQRFETGQEELIDRLLQYAGFATIADIVPLTDENRIFASQAIHKIKNTKDPGLEALIEVKKLDRDKIDAGTIGFILAPCINSAGRLSNARLSYDLLKTTDPYKARILAQQLSSLNEERKNLTSVQTEIALNKIKGSDNPETLNRIITVFLPEAHESLSGIIAGRLKEEYNRPAFVITRSGDYLKGSGRSVESYNMISELQHDPDLFLKFGGHPMACGFTLKPVGDEISTVKNFVSRMESSCTLNDSDLIKRIWVDMELPFKYVSQQLSDELKLLEPYGLGNSRPVFGGLNIKIISANIIGMKRNALKLYLEDKEGTRIEGIMFGNEESISGKYSEIRCAERVNILFYPGINTYNGLMKPQIMIQSVIPK